MNRDPFAGRRSWPLSLLLLEIDVGERLPVVVADDEAGVRFLDGPKGGGKRRLDFTRRLDGSELPDC